MAFAITASTFSNVRKTPYFNPAALVTNDDTTTLYNRNAGLIKNIVEERLDSVKDVEARIAEAKRDGKCTVGKDRRCFFYSWAKDLQNVHDYFQSIQSANDVDPKNIPNQRFYDFKKKVDDFISELENCYEPYEACDNYTLAFKYQIKSYDM